jgi:hypothetical protein
MMARRCLAAAALALGGILQAAGSALHPDDTAATRYFFDPRWPLAHVVLALSFLLLIFGLMGLFDRGLVGNGWLGLAGFVLSVAGCALLVGVTFAEAFLLPIIAANQPARPLAGWLEPTGPLAGAVVVSLAALFCYNLGFVVVGVTADYAGKLPRGSGSIVAIATLLTNGEFLGPIGFAAYVTAGIALGLALAWWGLALSRLRPAEEVIEAKTVGG